MAGNFQVTSLAPLNACFKLRKLDLRGSQPVLHDQVEDLRLACTQLADPSSVVLEGLVHELQPSRPGTPWLSAYTLCSRAGYGAQHQSAITAAGAIPLLVRLLGADQRQKRFSALLPTMIRTRAPSPLLVPFHHW